MRNKNVVSSLIASIALFGCVEQGHCVTSYTATEQYVKNAVKAESNRTDIAINNLRQEVIDANYLKSSSIIAGENVTVTTNEDGKVVISASGGSSGATDYSDLSNKPSINGVVLEGNKTSADLGIVTEAITNGLASEAWVQGQNYTTEAVTNGLATTAEVTAAEQRAKQYTDDAVMQAGTVTPEIVTNIVKDTKISQFTNDAGYVTESVTNGLASASAIPTKTSQLENDNGFVTESITNGLATAAAIPTNNDQLANGAGYVTETITNGLVASSSLATVATSGSYNDLSDKPTKVSDFTNDAGYVTDTITNGLATTEDLAQKAPASNIQKSALSQEIQDTLDNAAAMQFTVWYPNGSITSNSQFTEGIKYELDIPNHTASIKPFCKLGETSDNDNSDIVGDVVIPPFIVTNGESYVVTAILGASAGPSDANSNLVSVIAPTTVKDIGRHAFRRCIALLSVSAPSVTNLPSNVFQDASALVTVEVPSAEAAGASAFRDCKALTAISMPSVKSIGGNCFDGCTFLREISMPSIIELSGQNIFRGSPFEVIDCGNKLQAVPTLAYANSFSTVSDCKIVIPDALYTAWTTTSPWDTLTTKGYRFLPYSKWEYARRYEVDYTESNSVLTNTINTIFRSNIRVEGTTLIFSAY